MKRLLKQLSLVFVLPLIFSGIASASNHFWKVEISDPTSTNQLRTFNIEYTALSVESDDVITVELYQDGDQIDDEQTAPGGDSGVFEVTVDEDDTYVYQLISSSSLDPGGEPVPSEARAVTVETPEDEEGPIVTVEPELTPEQEADLIAPDGGAGGDVAGAADDTDNDSDGDANGEVSDEAATTTNDGDEGDVLGAEDTAASTDNTLRTVLAVAALALLAYYWFFYRNGRVNPFSKNDE